MPHRIGRILRYLPCLIKSNLASCLPSFYGCLKIKPSLGVLNITDRCCFKCVMCGQWKEKEATELSTKEWIGILGPLKNLGVKTIGLSGGEPCMRSDICEIISHSAKLGMETGVITNGFLLDEKSISGAVKSGSGSFSISMDSAGETFDTIRGVKGSYEKVLDSCRLLSRHKKQGLHVYLYYTLMKKTLGSYKEVFAVAREFDFPVIVNLFDHTPYFFEGVSPGKDELWIKKDDFFLLKGFQKFVMDSKRNSPVSVRHAYVDIDYFGDYFQDPLQKGIPCAVSQQRIGIDPSGNVYGGCWSMGSFGSLKNRPLTDIIGSKEYKDRHKDMFYKKCPGCSCGYPGNLRHYFPSILREAIFCVLPFSRKQIGEHAEK